MATRPTNALGASKRFLHIEPMYGGCLLRIEYTSKGSGFIGRGLSPLTEIYVNKDNKLSIKLSFELKLTCFKDWSEGAKKCTHPAGCQGTLEMDLDFDIDIDVLLPEGPFKDAFKKCFQFIDMTDAMCILRYQSVLAELIEQKKVMGDFKDMLNSVNNPDSKWWQKDAQGQQLGASVLAGLVRSLEGLLEPFKGYWKEGWKFFNICTCGTISKYVKEESIRFIKEKVEEEKPKWENFIRENVYAEQQAFLAGNNDPINNMKSYKELTRQFESEGPRNLT